MDRLLSVAVVVIVAVVTVVTMVVRGSEGADVGDAVGVVVGAVDVGAMLDADGAAVGDTDGAALAVGAMVVGDVLGGRVPPSPPPQPQQASRALASATLKLESPPHQLSQPDPTAPYGVHHCEATY